MATVLIVDPTVGTGVYASYAALQTGVLDWSQRPDLTAQIPTFIEMAERAMFRELSLRATATTATGLTSGPYIDIPLVLNAIERVEINTGSRNYTLDYTSANGITRLTDASGIPARYAVDGTRIKLLPAPAGNYTYTVYYRQTPAFLTSGNPSNAILAAYPDLYLCGALTQLSRYIMDSEQEQKYMQAYISVLDSIQREQERRRLPVSGGLQIKARRAR